MGRATLPLMARLAEQTATSAGAARLPTVPLFLVAGAALGVEVALARYFAIASWSEYGYWVISIAMAGFAASGVVLSLFRDGFLARAGLLLSAAPASLALLAAAGFIAVTRIPFNPLELQNPQLLSGQLASIAGFYVVLFPYFFATGLYIGLCFLAHQKSIPALYGADLLGAGLGALYVLGAMYLLHPFDLVLALMPVFALATLAAARDAERSRLVHAAVGVVIVVVASAGVWRLHRADYTPYKAIYPPLHVPESRIVAEVRSPRGLYTVLENFTERLDTDFSNNFAALSAVAPPGALGVYVDGNRVAALPRGGEVDYRYLDAALDALPYRLRQRPWVLLVGTRGGFRIAEAVALGAGFVDAIEPDPVLFDLVSERLPDAAEVRPGGRSTLLQTSPRAHLRAAYGRYDLIDIASDFPGQADVNKYALTVQGLRTALLALSGDGILSVPAGIREFTVYATKTAETVRRALASIGVEHPDRHVIVYRSAWNVRFLVSRRPFAPADVAAALAFAEARSFDVPFPPPAHGERRVWNQLPVMSFQPDIKPTDDAVRGNVRQLLSPGHAAFRQRQFFDLTAPTDNRPLLHAALRAASLPTAIQHLGSVPREELGLLINIAVLGQAVLFAVLILGLPLVRWRHELPPPGAVLCAVFYFAGLGLGYLAVQMWLIEKASVLLGDRTAGFATVLAAMLVCSGLGSLWSASAGERARSYVVMAGCTIALWAAALFLTADLGIAHVLEWPAPARVAVLLLTLAPVAVALGVPFPLGMAEFEGKRSAFLPWAWALNGAFSVIATPLANLLAQFSGLRALLVTALVLYVIVLLTFPARRRWSRVK